MLIEGENIYDILGIEKDADKRTIKQAYAKLVKQYHPEEQPEEWKRIHDAYECAMENASGQKQKISVPMPLDAREQERDLTNLVNIPQPKEVPNTPVENSEPTPDKPAEIYKMSPTDSEDVFEKIDEIAEIQRKEEEKALEDALNEIGQLAWNNKFKKTDWKEFFEHGNLLPIISHEKFLRELGGCFAYNQIDFTLYFYLNKQIGMIDEYIREHNADMTRSKELAAVRYAKEKVRLAHKRYWEEQVEERLVKGAGPIILALLVLFTIILMIIGAARTKKEAQSQRQGITTEWQSEWNGQQQDIYILE